MKPRAIGPDQTEWQADEHRPWIPVANDGDGAENAEAERDPFQLLFEPCQRHQIDVHAVPSLRIVTLKLLTGLPKGRERMSGTRKGLIRESLICPNGPPCWSVRMGELSYCVTCHIA